MQELAELIRDGINETVISQVEVGQGDRHGDVRRDGADEVVVAELEHGERGGAEGVERAVEKVELSDMAGGVAGDAGPRAGGVGTRP